MADVEIRIEGAVGCLTLNRPDALNALTYEMALAIDDALDHWAVDDAVAMVVIDGVGDRAFCAGGDIAEFYRRTLAGDHGYGRGFWRDEYRLNARIAHYQKPYVALMDGIVMGGGVGLSGHGSHRIVTEHSMVAMPECGIGLIPDVGGTFILSRSPGHLGEYLGLTGARMAAADAILAGFADFFVPADRLDGLVATLIDEPDTAVIERFATAPPVGSLAMMRGGIDEVFALSDMRSIMTALDGGRQAEWPEKTRKSLTRNCPLSMHATLRMIRDARRMDSVEQALAMEYRFTWRSLDQGEFMEGIRAAVIDKDRDPCWAKPGLDDVGQADVDAMLASLNENELTF